MRQYAYMKRKQEEGMTPKGIVLAKYPHAVARRSSNDPSKGSSYNRWGVFETPDSKVALGSYGTTATAWSTAAKTIWRDERRDAHDKKMQELMGQIAVALQKEGHGRKEVLSIIEVIEGMRNDRAGGSFTLEEFIEFLKA